MERLISSYTASALAKFHRDFYSTKPKLAANVEHLCLSGDNQPRRLQHNRGFVALPFISTTMHETKENLWPTLLINTRETFPESFTSMTSALTAICAGKPH